MLAGAKSGLRPGFALAAGLTIACIALRAAVAQAQPQPQPQALQLNALFQDHAVLQREKPITVWGLAPAGEAVTVSLQTSALTTPTNPAVQTKANADGRWSAVLPAMGAGGPYVLTAQGSSGSKQSAHDLLVGDVFLCSGQSNMEMSVLRAGSSYDEIKKAANDTIRLLNVEKATSATPLLTFVNPVSWQAATPATVADWSAVCFFFARELQASTHVPMGLVQSTWSGSNIRPWMSEAQLHANGGYEPGLRVLATYAKDPVAGQRQFADLWEQWWRSSTGDRPGAEPWSAQSKPPSAQLWRPAPTTLGDWRTWDVAELKNFTGLVWYRTLVTLTPAQARSLRQQAAVLTLGKINQVDETWINGHAVGNTFGYGGERTYRLPPGMLRAGPNVLAVNVLSTYGEGGLLTGGAERAVHLPGGESIPLNGVWQYRIVPSKVGSPPRAPWESVGGLSTIYNAMIAPLGSYGLRGVLWYQGESNTGESNTYRALLTGLMADWRRQLGPQLPFLIVQLPNFGPLTATPAESEWADLREAQRLAVKSDAHAALAVTIDIGEPRNLHPTNKQDVGQRLARAARHLIYADPSPPSGPVPLRATRGGEQVTVEFGDLEQGLVAYGHDKPIGFQLCADSPASCRFADAAIDGSSVILAVANGSAPTRVRYCWADSPICTLFEPSGLPAGPFELRLQ